MSFSAPSPDIELSGSGEAVLEQLRGETKLRRAELAEEIEDYPRVEQRLREEGLVESAGDVSVREDGGDVVTYRTVTITQDGERALRAAERGDDEPEPVEPERHTVDESTPDWDELPEGAAELVDATESVELVEDHDDVRTDDAVVVTLSDGDALAEAEMSTDAWRRAPRDHVLGAYRQLFGGGFPADAREIGVWQAVVMDHGGGS